jgi:hypothetical protein
MTESLPSGSAGQEGRARELTAEEQETTDATHANRSPFGASQALRDLIGRAGISGNIQIQKD